MANKAILDVDPVNRRQIIFAEEDDKTYIVTRQDCSSIAEAAKAMSELPHDDKSLRPVALIPEEILNRSILEGWFHDKAKWRAWANDPDNRDFRITKGHL